MAYYYFKETKTKANGLSYQYVHRLNDADWENPNNLASATEAEYDTFIELTKSLPSTESFHDLWYDNANRGETGIAVDFDDIVVYGNTDHVMMSDHFNTDYFEWLKGAGSSYLIPPTCVYSSTLGKYIIIMVYNYAFDEGFGNFLKLENLYAYDYLGVSPRVVVADNRDKNRVLGTLLEKYSNGLLELSTEEVAGLRTEYALCGGKDTQTSYSNLKAITHPSGL